jgi:ABC-2 type transport system permease protein
MNWRLDSGRPPSCRRAIDAGRVHELMRKEFIQVLRDPRLRRIVILAPIFQLLIFGYAVSTDVRRTATFVVDQDRTQVSRELVETLTASGYFRVVGESERSAELTRALERGRALVGLEIPRGFDRALGDGRGADVQLIVDGTNSNTAIIAAGYAERIIASFGQHAVPGVAPVPAPPVELRERAWFNPGLLSRNYNVPGVVGILMLLICLLLTSLAVVREREIGTLEQLMVSPLRPIELVAGKALPFALLSLLDLAIVLGVALLWFRIPFAGNLLLLVLASVLYLLSGLGTGLLVSTISRTQQEAFMATFLIFMPTILLSGFMFPVENMPAIFRWLTLLNPVRHYLVIVREIFLKGTGLGALWQQYAALLAIGVGILAAAGTRFHKTWA